MKLNKLFFLVTFAAIVTSASICSSAYGMEKINTFFNGSIENTFTQEQTEHAQCSICQEEFNNQDNLSILHCTHVPHIFHKECLERWMINRLKTNLKITCPICIAPIRPPLWLLIKHNPGMHSQMVPIVSLFLAVLWESFLYQYNARIQGTLPHLLVSYTIFYACLKENFNPDSRWLKLVYFLIVGYMCHLWLDSI